MKKLLTLAIILASASAYATRARVTALGNPLHINDVSTIATDPSDIFNQADSATIETGKTNATTTDDGAEATVVRTIGNAKWGFTLGHDQKRTVDQRTAAGVTLLQQNPFDITYGFKAGDLNMAGTLVYSNYNDKKTETKESTTTLRFGLQNQSFDASIDLGLVDSVKVASTAEFKGSGNIIAKGGYFLNPELYLYGRLDLLNYKNKVASVDANDVKTTNIEVGVIETVKKDGNEFFYGAGLRSENTKDSKADTKDTAFNLPLIIGLETNASEWLTLRGSVTQKVLINNDKTENAGGTVTETSPGPNSTTFAAGAGLKLGKINLDGAILVGGKQNIDVGANNLLTTVGMTYNF